ncbi:hypothetical protein LCGC14_2838030 [marine sediment metagenome]|uniref:Uncharacterized protein n=1 Tax=marine sediment metagenome TaxID=412755 RepID=A0A0F8YCA9_9ZZZZ
MDTPMRIGYVLLARQIVDSEIFGKPASWLKIFIYLVTQAQYEPYKKLLRGQCYTTYADIAQACGVTRGQIDHATRFMKSKKMLATRKATRGMVVTICNYDTYQDTGRYQSDAESDTKATQKRHTRDAIKENKETKKQRRRVLTGKEDAYAPGCWTNAERLEILRLRELLIQDGWRPGQNERTHSSTGG